MLKRIKRALRGSDWLKDVPPELTPADVETLKRVKPYTMTSTQRLSALIVGVRYAMQARLEGDIVECGVWRGGSMMAVALTLLDMGIKDRHLHLFDTYEGFPPPTKHDVDRGGKSAAEQLDEINVTGVAGIDGVKQALASTGYPASHLHFIKGKVEDTIPQAAPEKIALLRLDTDWYESTRHELIHLYPRLQEKGVLIIDDYGHWQGARRAVQEYFEKIPLLLNVIDYTGRIAVKTHA